MVSLGKGVRRRDMVTLTDASPQSYKGTRRKDPLHRSERAGAVLRWAVLRSAKG